MLDKGLLDGEQEKYPPPLSRRFGYRAFVGWEISPSMFITSFGPSGRYSFPCSNIQYPHFHTHHPGSQASVFLYQSRWANPPIFLGRLGLKIFFKAVSSFSSETARNIYWNTSGRFRQRKIMYMPLLAVVSRPIPKQAAGLTAETPVRTLV